MDRLTLQQKTPTNIEVDLKQHEVRIAWADDHRSVYTLDYLRQICPCAVCDKQRENQDPSRDPVAAKGQLRPEHPVEKVGNYALQFFWADGHNTGVYAFEFLRRSG